MMFGVPKDVLDQLRKRFPEGSRVELVFMSDWSAPPKGTRGTVRSVDDIGTIHVDWDNGRVLGVVYGEDSCRRID